MGERKVLNKYFPPDFDPAALPRGKRAANDERKVRMMLPMSVRCNTCGNFMYKGTKFNTRMETVAGEAYLGLKIFRFYFRCTNCAAEFCMKTDPKSTDYIMEQGATRNYEPWRDQAVSTAEAQKAREEEEMGNAMRALENRTLDSKREMDIMAALDEVQTLNARHNKVSTEDALAALQREAARQQQDIDAEELEDLALFHQLKREQLQQQIAATAASPSSSSSDDEAGAGPSGTKRVRAGSTGVGAGETEGPSKKQAVSGLGNGGGGLSGVLGGAEKDDAGPSGASKPAAAAPVLRPMFKVVAKPKAAPAPAAKPAVGGGQGKDDSEGEAGVGLAGLLGYGSDSSS